MPQEDPQIWHARDMVNINRTLDVSPIGWHERDKEGMSEAQKEELSHQIRLSGQAFNGYDPITIDMLGGPVWAFRRHQVKSEMVLKPLLSLGQKPAVSPACREILEQVDLGDTDFLPIKVLDIPREREIFPELYILHVRNAKQSLDVERELADRNLKEIPPLPGFPKLPMGQRFRFAEEGKARLSKSSLEGPDIWRESQATSSFRNNLFVSGRLYDLLKGAGMHKPWGFQPVELV